MKENKTISKRIEKTIKKWLSQAFFLLFLSVFVQNYAQAVNVSSWTYFRTLLLAGGTDIQLSNPSNTLNYIDNISSLTYSSSTIRGGLALDIFTLRGSTRFSAFWIGDEAKIHFIGNLTFMNFRAQSDPAFRYNFLGGAIYAAGRNAKFIFMNSSSSFISNNAEYGGAAVLISSSYAHITNSTISFFNNRANRLGGALYLENSSASITNSTISFFYNKANNSGGAVYLDNSTISFTDTFLDFTSNTALMGGAIYADNSRINITANSNDIVFKENTAQRGGDIYMSDSQLNLIINTNKSAQFNSGIYAVAGSSINISGGGKIILKGDSYFQSISSFDITNSLFEVSEIRFVYERSSHIYVANSTISFLNSNIHFMSNISKNQSGLPPMSGGGLYIYRSLAVFDGVLNFNENAAVNAGGAAYISYSKASFTGAANFSRNTVVNSGFGGAAIYIEASSVSFIGSANFNNNYNGTGTQGATIYAQRNSSISFFANRGDIIFSNNTSAYDIYLDAINGGNRGIYFNASEGRKIEVNSINAPKGDIIEKTGEGSLFIKGKTDYKGRLNLYAGDTNIRADYISISTLSMSNAKFSIIAPSFDGNSYNFVVEDIKRTVFVDRLEASNSIFGFNLYFKEMALDNDVIIATNTIYIIGRNNKTEIEAFGFLAEITTETKFNLIRASSYGVISSTAAGFYDSNEIIWHLEPNDKRKLFYTLDFSSVSGLVLHLSTAMYISVENLTRNQSEVKTLLNLVKDNEALKEIRSSINLMRHKDAQKTLDELSGVFLVNTLVLSSQRDDISKFLNRLSMKRREEADKESNLWIQFDTEQAYAKGEDSQTSSIDYSKYGWQTGYDIINVESFIFGIYFAQSIDNIKQGLNKADIMHNGIGTYLAVYNPQTTVLFNLNAAYANFDAQRDVSFLDKKPISDFSAALVRGAAEVEFKVYEEGALHIRPFVGARGAYIRNSAIEEKGGEDINLYIAPQNYTRFDIIGGLNIGVRADDFDFYGRALAGYILNGGNFGYDISFSQTKNSGIMNIENTPLNKFYYGLGAGASYLFQNYAKVFVNLQSNIDNDVKAGYFVQIGLEISLVSKPRIYERRKEKIARQIEEKSEQARAQNAQENSMSKRKIDLISELNKNGNNTLRMDSEVQEAVNRRNNKKMRTFKLSAALFESNSFELLPEAYEEIRNIAKIIKEFNYKRVIVEGHTDSSGDETHNVELSQDRAIMVYYQLYQEGIDNMDYIGFGSQIPLASNETKLGREQNRRVEIFVEIE
ncbi:MAG: OmpA family protein [Elusimicrobiota bacterium]|jgi:predicted outer membrane repeat protein|nr:OmpA family protein [Elusimicrobiota bacterium]